MSFKILVGGYSNVITTLSFDGTTSPPTLNVVGESPAGTSPSWIASYPSQLEKPLILATNEVAEGKVLLLRVEESGLLELLQSVDSQGRDPAHLWVGKDEIVVANYSSGSLLTIPIRDVETTPRLLPPPGAAVKCGFPGVGPVASRQEASHPHQVYGAINSTELFVPDLGSDRVWRASRDAEGVWDIKGAVKIAPGHGPRHVILKDGILYVLNELTNSLSSYDLPPLGASTEAKVLSTLSTLTPPAVADPEMLAAEILLTTYPEPLLYVSNRNDPHPEGDSISIFSPSKGGDLKLVSEIRTGLKHLRAAAFGGDGDKYLILAGQNGGGIKVYERAEGGKSLKELAHLAEGTIIKPTSLVII